MRRLFSKFLTIILVISFTSCTSLLNNKGIDLVIATDPTGAKIYVDNVYYGLTNKEIRLTPDKTYKLRLVKDGYDDIEVDMETKFSLRKGHFPDHNRCLLNLFGTVLIFPISSLKSVYCRDFTTNLYNFDLTQSARLPKSSYVDPRTMPLTNNVYSYGSIPQNPELSKNKNIYLESPPPQGKMHITITEDNDRSMQQPIFNSQSEFARGGNESDMLDEKYGDSINYNNNPKYNYYNWQ